ncbi:MAG: hypothetical protein WCD35_17345 [Mycobacteriales bacterium]
MPRHCPLCGLFFRGASELDWHARDDHQPVRVEEREEHIARFFQQSGRPRLGMVYVPL